MDIGSLLNDQRFGLAVGGTFTLVVCWLIFVVPFYSPVIAPEATSWGVDPATSEQPRVWVVEESRPEWLDDRILWKGINYATESSEWMIDEVGVGPLPSETCASFEVEWSSPQKVPCKRGWILVLTDDRLLANAHGEGDLTHGRTFLPDEDNDGQADFPLKWATIVLSNGTLESDVPGDVRDLPVDAFATLWAHELLHGLGFGHTYTRVIPGVDWLKMERTGSILNRSLYKGGWNGAGLPNWEPSYQRKYKRTD